MRLNWFSPLPPAKTGIADFTAHVLPALREHGEIVLWTDQGEWDPYLESYASVRCYRHGGVPWDEANRADMTIYHIGNNPAFHALIWQVSCSHPGIVVLHDTCLQHLLAGVYLHRQDYAGYSAQMKRYYGREGMDAAQKFWDGLLTTEYMAERYPLTPLALENALGGVVHTRESFQILQKENRWPVAYFPLPYPASSHHSVPTLAEMAARRAAILPYRLIVAGYIGLNRRLDSLLLALAGFPEKEKFHVDVYGELWNDHYVCTQVCALGLENIVTVHGFVPEQELNAALAAAHLAINLRYPTMGEASASQLRFWDYALPTLVTKVGWYAELPETVVGFVRPDHEITDLQRHFEAFLANPVRFAEMGIRGRCLLEMVHAPEAYARALFSFAREVRGFRPHAIGNYFVKRVGRELSRWIASSLVEQGGRRIAMEIATLTSEKGKQAI